MVTFWIWFIRKREDAQPVPRVCDAIAIALEGKREGLSKRRAQDLLDTYFVKLPVGSFSDSRL